jgi:hypothetical protein
MNPLRPLQDFKRGVQDFFENSHLILQSFTSEYKKTPVKLKVKLFISFPNTNTLDSILSAQFLHAIELSYLGSMFALTLSQTLDGWLTFNFAWSGD